VRIARRAAGVDDRRQVFTSQLRFASADLLVQMGPTATLHQAVPCQDAEFARLGTGDGLNRHDELEIGQRRQDLEDLIRLLLVADDDAARLAVANLVFDLPRSQRCVQRHIGATR
jgi:hypothetical protein